MRSTTLLLLTNVLWIAACSGGNTNALPAAPTVAATPPPASEPPPGPPPPTSFTITAGGFTPSELSATVGSRVTFVNADSRPHDLLGGPDHTRRECPEIDVVGFIVPGQSRETGVFSAPQTCEFHDHMNVGNPAFQGRIVVR